MAASAADFVIVGAGAAGSVLARRLADRTGASVLLLEAGPVADAAGYGDGWRLGTPPDWGYTSEPRPDGATPRLRRGRLLGGTSWLTRFAVRGAAADFDAWAARGNPGWAFDDVLPSFRRLEADLEFGADPWHGAAGPVPVRRYPGLPRTPILLEAVEAMRHLGFPWAPDHNAPGAVGVGPMPMSVLDGRRVTTFDAYLPEDDRPAALEVRPDCLVDIVVVEGGRAVGVRLADGSVIGAGTVILAAGTYGSPPILLRSGIGPAPDLARLGIPVVADLPGVGAHLADHPGVDLDAGYRGEGTAGPLLHAIATWHSGRAPAGSAPDLMIWITDPDAGDPGFYLDPVLLKPESRGAVRLRSTDPLDPPRITLPEPHGRADLERLGEGYARAIEVANHPAIRELCVDAPPALPRDRIGLEARIRDHAYSLPHVVGTCRMGPAPADGDVVDHLGRVHGVGGLHVIDASIMPDAPSGFPHVITIMAAEHLAQRI
jgi:choline dehydrogenase